MTQEENRKGRMRGYYTNKERNKNREKKKVTQEGNRRGRMRGCNTNKERKKNREKEE